MMGSIDTLDTGPYPRPDQSEEERERARYVVLEFLGRLSLLERPRADNEYTNLRLLYEAVALLIQGQCDGCRQRIAAIRALQALREER